MATRVIYMRCVANAVEDAPDGGIIRFVISPPRPPGDVLDAQLAVSFRRDEPMRDYAVTKEDKLQKQYRVTIEEVAPSDEGPTQA